MNYIISSGTSFIYKNIVKPILFTLKPDAVHEAMIKSGSLLQRLPGYTLLLSKMYAYDNPSLHIENLGPTFCNPIGLSAGMDKDGKLPPTMKAVGFGFVECGSVTLDSYGGNPRPWYTRLPRSRSIIVNSGLRSDGAEEVIKHVSSYNPRLFNDFPLNISIAKTNSIKASTLESGIADYISSLKLWEEKGNAQLYTINISCPNTYGGEPYTTPVSLENLLSAIDELKIEKPIFIKMPIDKSWIETKKLLEVCDKHDVQGITLGNLYKDRSTVNLQEEYDTAIKGNFSGKPCWESSNDLLERAYAEYPERFIFSGVGGVFSAEDAYTKIKLGATFVQLITGLIFEGPSLIGQINKGLVEMLEKDGYTNISQAVGVDNRYLKR